MTPDRFRSITDRYAGLRVAVLGDFCLDRYLEIDPARAETSIETGLPVHNVVRVRSQPGAAGTILNNLVALGIGTIHALGFCGTDGEGHELRAALQSLRGVRLDDFLATPERRTFTYCKPLLVQAGGAPVELNRLDSKNWTPTPPAVEDALVASVRRLVPTMDALILLDQVDLPETGVVTSRVREAVGVEAQARPSLWVLADSRRGLRDFPPVVFKLNAAELASLTGHPATSAPETVRLRARDLARQNRRPVFVTLAENGIVGALPDGTAVHSPALPLRGEIDIVGAGDAVTANLTAALAAGANVGEAVELANAAASVVIHQLGTTGTAAVVQLAQVLTADPD